MLTRDELLDWLALYEIDPWGEGRADVRAGVQSIWSRGGKFDDLRIPYPHVPSDTGEISEEDEIAAIEAIAALNNERPEDAPA